MIPRHLSLVTQLPEREAALRAIIAVEEGAGGTEADTRSRIPMPEHFSGS